jgi:squalene-associated FAD-dependent desaturase
MSERGVAIIGGGWAGMAAAVTLAQAGTAVSVFESAKSLGGRARTVVLDGLEVDNGQHILLGAYHETLALIAAVNPQAPLQRRSLELSMPPDFALRTPALPAPLHLVAGLLGARGLSVTDRLRAMRLLLALRLMRFQLRQDMPLSNFLDQHGQPDKLKHFLWHPLCLAALNTPPDQASAQVFLNVLRDSFSHARADSDLVLPGVNLSQLFPEPAASLVEARGGSVRTAARVTALHRDNGGWSVEVDGTPLRFAQVICAAPPPRAAELLEPLPGMERVTESLRRLEYQSIHTVYLQYPAETRLASPMLGLSKGLGQWVFDRGQLGGPAGLLAVVISAGGAHEALTHDELAAQVATELASALGLSARLVRHQVIAEKRATFACTPNLARPAARTTLPGLYLAGDYVAGPRETDNYPATIEGAVRSGVQCARLILESHRQSHRNPS